MLATIAAVLGIFYAAMLLIAGTIIYSLIADNEALSSAVDYLRARREDDREPATV